MNIQWYPGHMTKAKRSMQEDIKLVDLVIEILDARAPFSSRNPDIQELGKNKSRLVVLNKADLADEKATAQWKEWFQTREIRAVSMDARKRNDIRQIDRVIQEVCRDKIERDRRRGILNRPIRAMVVGIPNCGKSTLINGYVGKACAKTGNKPGVTKGKQWIRMGKNVELMDTPGILWPKFEDPKVGEKLAFVGTINDDIIPTEELALHFIRFLQEHYPEALRERYFWEEEKGDNPAEHVLKDSEGMQNQDHLEYPEELQLLYGIARKRGCLKMGNEYDTEKASDILLDDFRQGRLGRITLELPQDID